MRWLGISIVVMTVLFIACDGDGNDSSDGERADDEGSLRSIMTSLVQAISDEDAESYLSNVLPGCREEYSTDEIEEVIDEFKQNLFIPRDAELRIKNLEIDYIADDEAEIRADLSLFMDGQEIEALEEEERFITGKAVRQDKQWLLTCPYGSGPITQ